MVCEKLSHKVEYCARSTGKYKQLHMFHGLDCLHLQGHAVQEKLRVLACLIQILFNPWMHHRVAVHTGRLEAVTVLLLTLQVSACLTVNMKALSSFRNSPLYSPHHVAHLPTGLESSTSQQYCSDDFRFCISCLLVGSS